jgi:hypothetical protein
MGSIASVSDNTSDHHGMNADTTHVLLPFSHLDEFGYQTATIASRSKLKILHFISSTVPSCAHRIPCNLSIWSVVFRQVLLQEELLLPSYQRFPRELCYFSNHCNAQ